MISNFDYEVCHESLEISDPTPNVHNLFKEFDYAFFGNKLSAGAVTLDWSETMKTAAGVCSYERRSKFCKISLSKPLLSLRSRKDLVETMLHEMIHAYLFVTNNNRDRSDHGPNFKNLMQRINTLTGANITVYHDFHDEVHHYKSSWYRCNGPCQNLEPLFGFRKGKLDRGPCSKDPWYIKHKAKCNGIFVKVSQGPTKTSIMNEIKKQNTRVTGIQTHLKSNGGQLSLSKSDPSNIVPFSGKGKPLKVTKVKKSSSTADIWSRITNDPTDRNAKSILRKGNTPREDYKPCVVPFTGAGKALGSATMINRRDNVGVTRADGFVGVGNDDVTISEAKVADRMEVGGMKEGSAKPLCHEIVVESMDVEEGAISTSLAGEERESDFDKVLRLSREIGNADKSKEELELAIQASLVDMEWVVEAGDSKEDEGDLELAIQASLVDRGYLSVESVKCPVCNITLPIAEVNDHLNTCLNY